MGGRIDCYLDIASFFSYIGLVYLRRDTPIYAAHGIEIVYHPILVGAVMKATGNNPPIKLPAKAKYMPSDVARSCDRAGVPDTRWPDDFFSKAMVALPLRALHHIQQHYPAETYLATLNYLFYRFWTPPNANLKDAAVLRAELAKTPTGFNGAPSTATPPPPPLFSSEEVDAILKAATEQPAKDLLIATTNEAIKLGAFGAPWLWVRNSAGKEEAFFGSDRFYCIYKFLGLPYQDVALLDSASAPSASRL